MLGLSAATMCPGGPGCPGTDPTDALAALQASAAAGGFDTSQGSYAVDPTTGQTVFTPVKVPASTSLIPGISNTALAIGAAGLFGLVILSGGRR